MKASRLQTIFIVIWFGLAIPTVLIWRNSVFWVNIMSLYAILATHWGARNAAKAKEAAEESE